MNRSDVEREIGQLFMVGMPGPHLDKETDTLIREHHVGGIILFSRNIEDPLQLGALCRDLQGEALKKQGSPLFLAVDQEGGRVARLKEPFRSFPGNAAIGMDAEPVKRAIEFATVTSREMKVVGLNMNLAPVVDVQRGEIEKHLAGRSFGEDPEVVAFLGRTVVKRLQENGIMAVAKHFPGLGRADVDPHFHLPKIDIDLEELERINIPPFAAAIEEGVCGIMTSHAIYPALDPHRPATLSPLVLTELLRERMGFRGLTISDDLEMGAIAREWSVADGALQAFQAGADILLICKDQSHVRESLDLLRRALAKGTISTERLAQSLERIRKMKARFLGHREEISLASVKEYFKISA
ncbi:MAG: beta-N-acetylhexosaminidase [Deltaproteobacteria bacterium]|nr:beta-N-acetylhexosaminidase [Deltaproteobacteria bacterium]